MPALSGSMDFVYLFRKYDDELELLGRKLRDILHQMHRKGQGTGFGDVEGECAYILIRETYPEVCFEISPNCGWSTNYILAALTANGKGVVHSFELLPRIGREPIERVIRGNQHPEWDQGRLIVHVGDAREKVDRVNGRINFLLLDSCHEAWFADWYISTLFPRVSGWVMIQDIAFVDMVGPWSEAGRVWRWVEEELPEVCLIGAVEARLEREGQRLGYAVRRNLRSNAIVFSLPSRSSGSVPRLAESVESLLERAERPGGDPWEQERLLNQAMFRLTRDPTRANRHRLVCRAAVWWEKLGNQAEAARTYERALGLALQADLPQRIKGLGELVELFTKHGQLPLACQAILLLLWQRGGWRCLARALRQVGRGLARRALPLDGRGSARARG